MANFSNSPQDTLDANIAADFLGVLVERGVPVLDRDLNLRSELTAEAFRRVLEEHLGSGTPSGSASQFAIAPCAPAATDFAIQGGTVANPAVMLVAGVEIKLVGSVQYSEQAALHPGLSPALAPLTVNLTGQYRTDQVYVDVWFAEIDSTMDVDSATDLHHSDTYELETSVRLRPSWVVRVAEGPQAIPAPAPGHRHAALATLHRPPNTPDIDVGQIVDARVTDLDMPAQATQLNDGLDMFTRLCDWLAPRFDMPRPLSSHSARAGMSITISGANLDLGEVTIELGAHKAEGPSLPNPKPPKLSAQKKGRQSEGRGQRLQQVEDDDDDPVFAQASAAQAPAATVTAATVGLVPVPGLTEAQARLLTWTEVPVVGEPSNSALTFVVPQGLDGWVYVAVDNTAGRAYVQLPFYVFGPPLWARPGAQFKTFNNAAPNVHDSIALMGTFFDISGTTIEYALKGTDNWFPCTVTDATALGCTVKGPAYPGEYVFRVKNFAADVPVVSSDTIKVVKA